jgi:hypothetical protein
MATKKSPPQAQSTRSACTCGNISEDTNALAVVMLLKERYLAKHDRGPSTSKDFSYHSAKKAPRPVDEKPFSKISYSRNQMK